MSNSSLITKFIPAHTGNYTKNRSGYGKIEKITVHHMASNLTIERLGALWQAAGRKGSSHYGVQHSNIGQYVNESDIAWTDGAWDSNVKSVTIETANSGAAPDWRVADDTLETLIKLVADIAKRNGLHPLVCGKTLTWHSMYKATECPGPYLLSKVQYITDEANKLNENPDSLPAPDGESSASGLYRVQVGAFSKKANAESYMARVKAVGFSAFITTATSNDATLYRVQVGAFASKANAEVYAKKVKNAGFEAFVIKEYK